MSSEQTKVAQRRRLQDRLELGSRTLSLFDREFADYMKKLRSADDFAREQAQKLKPILKESVSLVNADDYIGATARLAQFYEIWDTIFSNFDIISGELKNNSHKLLVDHLDDETKLSLLKYLKRPKNIKKASFNGHLVSRAGILDWFAGKFNARRRALRSLEKRVPALKELRNRVKKENTIADSVLNSALKLFNVLSAARAKGNIDEYVKSVSQLYSIVNPAKTSFDNFYDSTVQPLAEYIEQNLPSSTSEEKNEDKEEKTSERYTVQYTDEVPSKDKYKPDPGIAHGPIAPGPANPTTESIETKENVPTPIKTDWKSPPPVGSGFINPYQFTSKPTSTLQDKKEEKPEVKSEVKEEAKPEVKVEEKTAPKPQPKSEPKQKTDPTGRPLPMAPPGRKVSHQDFINHLVKLAKSDCDIEVLAKNILAYSEELEPIDPVASLKLLTIAEGLVK